MFDGDGYLKDEFIEDYDGCCTEVRRFISCLEVIKQGNSVSLGWLRFEDDIPIGTLTRLQQEFWKALEGDNFKPIEDGSSKHSFKNVIQNYETSDINDVLILGSLCEALCKTGVSINLLVQNESLIDKFVKEALLYCNCSLDNYQFSFSRAIHLLTVKTASRYFKNTKVFLLLKQRDKYSVFCTALLHIHRNHVDVVSKTLEQKFIEIPESIASSNLETETLNHIYDAIIWVLLNTSGFYLDKNDIVNIN